MSTGLILPGFGGAYDQTITTVAGADPVYGDPLDMSRCAHFNLQVKTWSSGDLALHILESVDGSQWDTLVNDAPAVAGDILKFPVTGGPYSLIKIGLISASTASDAVVRIVGYPMQPSN